MRPFKLSFLSSLLLFTLAASELPERKCDPEALIEQCKEELPPYSYSNSRNVMTRKEASNEIPVKLLDGEQYRLVFNISELPDEAVIRIYDGAEGTNRDLLKSSRDVPPGRDLFVFDPRNEDGGTIHISYEIPEPEERTCFAFVVGYKLSYLDD